MGLRSIILTVAAIAAGATATLALPNAANAERVYNYVEERWETAEDAARRSRTRGPSAKFNRRNVVISTREKAGTIIIHTDQKFLYYITGKGRAIRYGIGVGREGFGWNGTVKVRRKAEWPGWTPPPEMVRRERAKGVKLPSHMPGGINNPLGARALYLYKGGNDTMYRIHGTNQPWTIGLNMSSGCIRMMNKDVEHLYDKAKIGTKVVVVGPGKDAKRVFTTPTSFFDALFSS